MPEEIQYRGYNISSSAYQDPETEKWVPRAHITPIDESQQPEMPMSWEKEFDTQQEADDYAISGAQFYLDSFV